MKIFLKIESILGTLIYPFLLKFNKNVIVMGELKVKAFPYIDIRNNSQLYLGKNVTLNSSNYGYHINMYKGVKIFADGEKSEIYIGDNTRIHGSCIHAKSKIFIGKNCLIAANCHIIDSNGHPTAMSEPSTRINSQDSPKEIIIEDNVWIGANCIILKGVKIGEGSIVSAGSTVTQDVPKNVIVSGNPAKILI